jgi:hypothetical protein
MKVRSSMIKITKCLVALSLVAGSSCFAAEVSQTALSEKSSIDFEQKKVMLGGILGADMASIGSGSASQGGTGLGFGARIGYRIDSLWEVGVTGSYSAMLGGKLVENGTYRDSFGTHTISNSAGGITLFTAEGGIHPKGKLNNLFLGLRMGVGIISASYSETTRSNDPFFAPMDGTRNYSASKTGFAIGPVASYQFKLSEDLSIDPRLSYVFLTVQSAGSLQSQAVLNYRF